MSVGVTSGEFLFLSGYWLVLIPLFWGFLLWWISSSAVEQSSHNPSIVDIDITTHHYYHPYAQALAVITETYTSKKLKTIWRKPLSWMQGLVVSLFIIALAQPVLIGEQLPDPPPQRDIIFLVDTSVSMQLMDYSVEGEPIQRMQLLQNLLDEFASKMEGDRIAVIVFGESPYLLVPLTHDQGLIRRMLGRVTTTLAGRYSAVGDALLMALSMSKSTSESMSKASPLTASSADQTKRHQTFILFTDAHESLGNVTAAAAADLIAESDIPVFTVAIGSSLSNHSLDKESMAPISGGLYQAVNHALLDDIAKRTRGSSYQVHDSKAMEQALQDISKQRQNLATPEPHYEQTHLFVYPLLAGLLLLILQQLFCLLRAYRAESEGGADE
ncbi:MAG: VWA domain-containing protein [Thiotrichaceae bacterium]